MPSISRDASPYTFQREGSPFAQSRSNSRSPARTPGLTLLNLEPPSHLEGLVHLTTEICALPISLRHKSQQTALYAMISQATEMLCVPAMVAECSNTDALETAFTGVKAEHDNIIKAREEQENPEWLEVTTFNSVQAHLTTWTETIASLMSESGVPNLDSFVSEAKVKNLKATRMDKSDMDAWLRRVVGSQVSLAELLDGQDHEEVEDVCRKMLEENEHLSFVEHQFYKEALRLTQKPNKARKTMSLDDLRGRIVEDLSPIADSVYDRLNSKHLIDGNEWEELDEVDTPHRLVAYLDNHREDQELTDSFAEACRIGRRR